MQTRFKLDSNSIQTWFKLDSNLIQTWFKLDSNLIQTWRKKTTTENRRVILLEAMLTLISCCQRWVGCTWRLASAFFLATWPLRRDWWKEARRRRRPKPPPSEKQKKSDTLETSLLVVAVPPFSKCDNPDIIWVPKISVINLLNQFWINFESVLNQF